MRRLIPAFIAVSAIVGPLAGTAAAACSPPDLEFALRESPTVFVGEVVEVGDLGHAAHMRVIAVWKGADLPERVSTSGRPAEGADALDARRYQLGATYLVVPHDQFMPFPDDGCTATRPFTPQGTLIPSIYQAAVDAEQGRPPVVAASEPVNSGAEPAVSGTVFVIGAVVVLGLAVVAIGLRNWDRQPDAASGSTIRDNSPPPRRFAGMIGSTTRPSGMRSVRRLRGSKRRGRG